MRSQSLNKNCKLSITLIEAVTVIVIFAMVAAASGSILFSTNRSGSQLADKAEILKEADWAIDFMVNEVRWADSEPAVDSLSILFPTEDTLDFERDVDGDSNIDRVWYWRGFMMAGCVLPEDPGCNSTMLYRGVDIWPDALPDDEASLEEARVNSQVLSRFIVDNPIDPLGSPDLFPIFDFNSADYSVGFLLTIAYPGPSGDQNQTLRTRVTVLNAAP